MILLVSLSSSSSPFFLWGCAFCALAVRRRSFTRISDLLLPEHTRLRQGEESESQTDSPPPNKEEGEGPLERAQAIFQRYTYCTGMYKVRQPNVVGFVGIKICPVSSVRLSGPAR